MKIVICDNDINMLNQAKELTENFINKHMNTFENEVICFSKATDFVDYFSSDGIADIVIMDIELDNNTNGIDVVKSLSNELIDCKIVYLTGYIEYASPVYETEHEYFVLKTQIEPYFEKALYKACQSLTKNPPRLYIDSGFAKICINCSDILYMERNKRTTTVVCKDASYKTSEKIDDILKRLNEDLFIRCHNSYVVNAPKVKVYTNKTFTLVNGYAIKVTRSYKNSADEKFLSYIKNSFSN